MQLSKRVLAAETPHSPDTPASQEALVTDIKSDPEQSSAPPESWSAARRLALRVVAPIERFMRVEAGSGIVLLCMALVAFVWANSPWSASYDRFWHTPLTIGFGNIVFQQSLHFWINEFLMAIFFLVVGLEIKREIIEGALSEWRRAALPVAAALGGMIVPAGIYLMLNARGTAPDGWGVPMATDIAFAVGVFALMGSRVPAALRVLLLAVAIIDDIGAILVIALFYSPGLQAGALVYVAAGIVAIFTLHRMGIRPGLIFVFPGLLLWGGLYAFGVHPTLAGVIIGLLTPVRPWYGADGFLRVAERALADIRSLVSGPAPDDQALMEPLDRLSLARREALSPAKRIETALHPWVAFGVMPLFALANAGVNLQGLNLTAEGSTTVLLGVALGLMVGKPIGVLTFSWLSVKLKLCVLPPGVTWNCLAVVGIAAGIGFTMALFIAELAFGSRPELLGAAKLAILIATAGAAAGALIAGRFWLPQKQPDDIAAMTAADLEASSEYWTTVR